jgi:hypothetical protein
MPNKRAKVHIARFARFYEQSLAVMPGFSHRSFDLKVKKMPGGVNITRRACGALC